MPLASHTTRRLLPWSGPPRAATWRGGSSSGEGAISTIAVPLLPSRECDYAEFCIIAFACKRQSMMSSARSQADSLGGEA